MTDSKHNTQVKTKIIIQNYNYVTNSKHNIQVKNEII